MVRFDSPRLRWLGVSVLIGMGLVFLLAVTTIYPLSWNLLLQDWLLDKTTTEALPSDYLLVAMDEPSIQLDMLEPEELAASPALQLMRGGYPWSREVYALLSEKLLAAGARMVIFDLLLNSPRAGDDALAGTLRRHPGKIILASHIEFVEASDHYGTKTLDYPPTPVLADAAGASVGFASFPKQNVASFSDPKIRFFMTDATTSSISGEFLESNEPVQQFLGAAAARELGSSVPIDLRRRRFRYSRPGTVPRIPFYEVFVPAIWKSNLRNGEIFRDKIVLVGATAEGLKDYFFTPFGRLSGPEIQLHALAAIQRNQWLTQAGPGLILAGIPLAGGLVLLLAWMRRHAGTFVLGLLLGAAGWFGLSALVLSETSYFLPIAVPLLTWLVCGFGALAADVTLERRERSRLRGTLERYVSKDVVREIVENPDSFLQTLGGQRKEVVVLFSDLQGFTSAAEDLDPTALVALLNTYFGEMVEAVFAQRGTLDKFIGDALMATWGGIRQATPEEDAGLAVTAALEMTRRLAVFNLERQRLGQIPWSAGIGLCQGPVVFGNIGSQQKMEPTVIGDTVNLASRIEGLTRTYGCPILVDETIARQAHGDFGFLFVDTVRVKGRRQPEALFCPHASDEKEDVDAFAAARELYEARDFAAARTAFAELPTRGKIVPLLARCFVARCENLLRDPPRSDWDGIWDFASK